MLLQELFRHSLGMTEGMDSYLHAIREKLSELSTVGLKLEEDVKLAIILNGLPERYRYLVVSLEKQEIIDFDELTARLLEEELKVDPKAGMTALLTKKNMTLAEVVIDVDKWGISSGTVQGSVITAIRAAMMRVNAGSNTQS